ncbi:unnamed protein product [Cylicocyclus nassatus]|uniref:Elongator complex protein 1 n=1 Tax=Cylicocyclus nassatus TaxID=53992 RepID=A0AA36DVS0_CYLNA|nr:unnamed protein product [Cylicocyclus nassatus]
MRNVVLTKVSSSSSSDAGFLEGSYLFVEDNVSRSVYLVNREGVIVLDAELQFATAIPCSDQCDSFEPVDVNVLVDSNEICVILSSGQVLTVDAESHTMCAACFLGEECIAASWSPDQTSLVAVEGDYVVFYDRSFERFAQWEISSNEEGKDALVTVGWGAAETQFQGSAGKAAREKKVVLSKKALENDTRKPHIRWRADGAYVMVSFYEAQSGERRIAVFSKEGELMSRLKNQESVEEAIAVRPSGNYIATTKVTPDDQRIMVFYERNGEKRHETILHGAASERQLVDMQWDVESSCLCIHFRSKNADEVEIWTVSNYDWKRQWSARFEQMLTCVRWDIEKARQLSILSADGIYTRLNFDLNPVVCGSTALVISTDGLRFTDFDQCPVPPPMCGFSAKVDGALHVVAFDGDRVAELCSDFKLYTYTRDASGDNLTLASSSELKNDKQWRFFSFLTWYGEGLVVIAHAEHDAIVKIDVQSGEIKTFHECARKAVWLGLDPTSKLLVMANEDGRFAQIGEDGQLHFLYNLPSADSYDVKFAQERMLVRTPNFELFIDGKAIPDSVSSYLVSGDVCLYITLHHKLHMISLTDKQQVTKERAVELGSSLIACSSSGTSVTMQMPRGNLETIHPRPFVVREIKKLIDDLKYVAALKEMKKHRIDMNLLVDYKPDIFLSHVSDLIQASKDPDLINLLIAALNNSRSEWCNGTVMSDKVNRITDLLAKEVLSLPSERRIQMLVVALTAMLKSVPQRAQEALRLIKEETSKLPPEKRDIYTRKWLHHVGFFVKEAELFDAALSTYDLQLTAQVAEASNRDPKEYIPLLNELRKIEPESYRKYRIDTVREDWRGALRHLSELDEKWEEAVALIREKDLYSAALIIYKDSPRYKDVCLLYAELLESKAQWQEAAMLYDKTDRPEKVLRCLEMARDVSQYISRARAFDIPKEEFNSALSKMAAVLKSSGRYAEAAKALEHAEASAVAIGEAYAKAGQWLDAVNCTRGAKDSNLIGELLKQRAQSILDELTTKAEEVERYTKRLEVVRSIKEERILKIKEGVESGRDLEDIDIFSDAGSTMSVMSRRTTKTGMSRASTTATVRKRKQIDRKKQSLKEGGEYEDSALLLAIATHYKWINELTAELVQLLPALVSIDEWELAASVQVSVEKFISDASSRKHHIWPQKLHPRDLPGPLYALYTVDDVFAFPNDGGMPGIITMEPEMIPPTINTDIKWKLQVLEKKANLR